MVTLTTSHGKETGEATLLSLEVRGTGGGLEAGRTYRLFARLDPHARSSEAKRFLLLGWRAGASGKLVVEPRSRLDRMMDADGTTASAGEGTLFAAALMPTLALTAVFASDPLAATYRGVAQALRGAPSSEVRQATLALAQLAEVDSPIAPRIEGGSAMPWIRRNFSAAIVPLALTTPLEQFRYGGLLAAWDRPSRALRYLKALPNLMSGVGLDAKSVARSVRLPGDAQDDETFLDWLNLVEGVDPDTLFAAVWSSSIRDCVLDPHVTGTPSQENQRKVLTYLNDPTPDFRAKVYGRLAVWNNDLPRSYQAVAHWSDSAGGVVIENESSLREYWEKKLGAPPKP